MIPLKTEALLQYLQQYDYKTQYLEEADQLACLLTISEMEFPLFLRIYESQDLLQFLIFIPCEIVADKISDTARFLHLLNKELDIPGFGMDEQEKVVFYRLMAPTTNKQIEKELLQIYLKTAENACQAFANPIAAIATGQIELNELIQKPTL